ncbi:hypothetical protein CALCODRAFT_551764 [Calocera cornea HHB12733]|uniref:DUF7721 domain-containing protein n=1 Tax=Calocera cornea HHB12733 TaxID=1353952 RepID=A0A165DCN1_9BASI|nr:hypothetical protein CALCODRAFT_551764 [Calocera cornea HHB12733]
MDNFINLAKQGYQAYENSQGQGNNQNQNQGQQQQGQYGGQQQQDQNYGGNDQQNYGGNDNQQFTAPGGAQYNAPDHQNAPAANINHNEAVQQATQDAGSSGDSGLFSQAMSFISNNPQEHTQPVDEQGVQNAHDQAYNQGNASNLDAGGIGGAAAMQILKQFTSGGGSGGSQTQLISMAMSEASKLFDSAGGGSGGDKQTAVNSAAATVVKLLVQSKFSGAIGGSNSGGLSSLMGMQLHLDD